MDEGLDDKLGRLIAAERNSLTGIEMAKAGQQRLHTLEQSFINIQMTSTMQQQKIGDLEQRIAVLQGHLSQANERIDMLEETNDKIKKVIKL